MFQPEYVKRRGAAVSHRTDGPDRPSAVPAQSACADHDRRKPNPGSGYVAGAPVWVALPGFDDDAFLMLTLGTLESSTLLSGSLGLNARKRHYHATLRAFWPV